MKSVTKNIQAIIFTSGIDLSDKIAISQELLSKSKEVFDGEQIILPLPQDAPIEIPRIILRSKNTQYFLNISLDRISLGYEEKSEKTISQVKSGYLEALTSVMSGVQKITEGKITRLGFVASFVVDKPNATKSVASSYLKPASVPKNIHEVSIGVLKRENLINILTNIWFRISTPRNKNAELDDKQALVVFDINTAPELEEIISLKVAAKFFEEASSYIEENIDKSLLI